MLQPKKSTRSATTNFGKEEVLKIIIMLTITFSTFGDIDPIRLNNCGSRNQNFDIPGSQTCQFEQYLCKMLKTKKRIREAPRLTSVKCYIILFDYILKVFARNTRMSPFIMFSLSRINMVVSHQL